MFYTNVGGTYAYMRPFDMFVSSVPYRTSVPFYRFMYDACWLCSRV